MEELLVKLLQEEGADRTALLDQLAFNEKMAELGRLSVGIVHELNSPLSVIVSAAQLIQREEGLTEPIRELVARIDQEAQRLSGLARGILSFARREEWQGGEADVNDILHEVLRFLRYEAQKRSIVVIEELDQDLSPLAAESNRLKQVFINLAMNAFQAMTHGGTLQVRTYTAPDGRGCIELADTGPGISPELSDRIFEPFFTTKEQGQGTGLGLFITRNIVEYYGGSVGVRSVVGEGTTFIITLPVATER